MKEKQVKKTFLPQEYPLRGVSQKQVSVLETFATDKK